MEALASHKDEFLNFAPVEIFMSSLPSATLESALSLPESLSSLKGLFEERGRCQSVEGLKGSSKAFYLVQLWKNFKVPLVIITPDSLACESLMADLRYFLKHEKQKIPARMFPSWELLPYEPLSPLIEISGERLDILHSVLNGTPPLIVTSVDTVMQYVMPRSALKERIYGVSRGEGMDRDLLEMCLVDNGYEKSHLVEERGQFSTRGDILDIFLPSHVYPVRLEFFGDGVESIRHFDINSQISMEEIDQVTLLPVRELCLTDSELDQGFDRIFEFARINNISRSHLNEVTEKMKNLRRFSGMEFLAPFFYPERESLLSYLPENALIVTDEMDSVQEHGERVWNSASEEYARACDRQEVVPEPSQLFMSPERLRQEMGTHSCLLLGELKQSEDPDTFQVEINSLPHFEGKFDQFADFARESIRQDEEVTVVAPTKGHVSRVNQLLVEQELSLRVELGHLRSGFRIPDVKQVFVSEHEIFGRTHKHRQKRKSRSTAFQRGFQDLKVGDLLVHVDYGIGQFNGTRELKTGLGGGEFMEIMFADDQRLYVPMDSLAYLQKYVGAGEGDPPLSRLGGTQWKRQKKKVQESIREMAEDLLKVYAQRKLAEGYVYAHEAVQVQEFSDSFEYVETEDQLKAIEEVFEDMESAKPMDRLICGDVGYGKTEVAMRAAFRAVLDKKQVAVLVPTTILAQQHLNTFQERFHAHPVNIDIVSRFRTTRQQKATLKQLEEGKLDVIIGTHRLLSKDVRFSDLGLLVIDEEQRFGVKHKEQLKKLRSSVDVLTLTATPIPRTLHFSLMGVRDLSVIETPPSDRLAIKTYIRKFDENIIREAVMREIAREGQVYFVHNKVHSIHSMAALLKKILPDIRIGIGHGQMQERMLESVMRQFIDKEIDLLLCTSIVESGLDIPSANTIIINRADQFGLAQLYQLRGRVGRYKHQAYAYLLTPGAVSVSTEAHKRLIAIEEMSDLGAGFQLAARDMEIRGTGNMLGKNQSGHIATIGFDLYCNMIEETIRDLKGELAEEKIETEIDLQVKGYIPKEYIPELSQRLDAYRRLQLLMDFESIEKLSREIRDRYGPLPDPVDKLFLLMEIRVLCQRLHIKKIRLIRNRVIMQIADSTPIPSNGLMSLLDKRLRLNTEFELNLVLDLKGWREDMALIREYLIRLTELIDEGLE